MKLVQRDAAGPHAGHPAGRAASGRVGVAIAIRDEGLHQEVLDFLGRDARLEVVASLTTAEGLASAPAADVQVLCPLVAAAAPRATDGPVRLVVAEEMTVGALRAALAAGAREVFAWPAERDDLLRSLGRLARSHREERTRRGRVIAVAGARGGAGATFLATHLAAAFAARGARPVLVDVDPFGADLTAALGIAPEPAPRTVADLLPVASELSPDHVEDALVRDPRGFAVLLGPLDPDGPPVPAGLYRGAAALLAGEYDPVLLHVGRGVCGSARDVVALADRVLLLTTLDLFSLYGAKRVVASLGLRDRLDRCRVVVNRAARGGLDPKDVERVLGIAPTLSVRPDPRVRRAQQEGTLLPAGSRGAARDVRRIAEEVARSGALEPETAGVR